MKPIALGLLALFALAVSSGVALAGSGCSQFVTTKAPTTVASTDGSTPIVVPTTRGGG